jgi:hypothetical protein
MSKEQDSKEKTKKCAHSGSCKSDLTGIKTNSETSEESSLKKEESSVKSRSIKSLWLDSNDEICSLVDGKCKEESSSSKSDKKTGSGTDSKTSSKSKSDSKHKKRVIAKKIVGLENVHAGPLFKKPLSGKYVLEANGDAFFSGNLTVNGNIAQHDVYVENDGETTDYTVRNGDGINVIYTNSTRGPINIYLGTDDDPSFEANRTIVIKDVTLEFAPASSFNVNVLVPQLHHDSHYAQPRIEHYSNGALDVSSTGAYVVNTSGGAVTFKYFQANIPGAQPTWVIENQFSGNSRIPPHIGIIFIPASQKTRTDLINLH